MEFSVCGMLLKLSVDTLIAGVALIISIASLGTSIFSWRKAFRPLVTASVRTHQAGNVMIAYDLVLLNSGQIPARDITISTDPSLLNRALGEDASDDNRRKWLACFEPDRKIRILHNGDKISCSFGTTKGEVGGFWRYKASIPVEIAYSGWFGKQYTEKHEIQIIDSDSFTGFMWAK
ncbi:hypothetical protein [Methylophilus sp. TWE2]|uniref:hypothetical protein n=1 Tax=Methylophilus sp. TWE2 TaxID=1662285 RepID=UPI00067126B7|nr:hypothetical protein [Methylophilus sp. TWE2]AKR43593.1 hypothetical protein ACJ67_09275 [Methylophilus sp. TWE2]